MRWLVLAAISIAASVIALFGTFVPLVRPDGVEYLFVWPGGTAVVALSTGLIVLLAALHLALLAAVRRRAPEHLHDARTGRWLAPAAALGLVALGLLPAVPGVGERGAPVAFFLYDLRWWWLLLVVASMAWRAHALLGWPLRPRVARAAGWARPTRSRLQDIALFAAAIAFATATTPNLRFSGVLHGDEPKYVRYCETWYQGNGMDISRNVPMTERLRHAPWAVAGNLGLFARAVGEDTRALAGDLVQFAQSPVRFSWNRASGGDGFVTGRWGTGVYQIHLPGVSALLLPGYYIDRQLLSVEPGYENQFPAGLVMTNLTMLLLYGVAAVALLRLLRVVLAADGLAFATAAVAMLSLPVAAFPFQLYPELPALLVVLLASRYVLMRVRPATADPASEGVTSPVVAGAIAGALVWLHVRFLLLSAALAVAAFLASTPAERRRLVPAWTLALLSLCAYNYHVTGSWSPTALFAASEGPGQLDLFRIPDNLVGYALHGRLGLVSHAPWLLAALPGLAVLARRQPVHAAYVATVGLALVVTTSAYVLNPVGTPGRLVVAVVPLMAWPAAEAVRRYWSLAGVRVATVLSVIVSLDTAIGYNLYHHKSVGQLVDRATSGWKPTLALPEIRNYFTGGPDPGLLIVIALVSALAVATVVAFRRPVPERLKQTLEREAAPRPRPVWLTVGAVGGTVVALSTMATATIGGWTRHDYLPVERDAHRIAATALVGLNRCRVCFTSRDEQVGWTWLEPNPAREPYFALGAEGRTVTVTVRVDSADGFDGFGRLRIDFGDGSPLRTGGIVGSRAFTHTYRTAGAYRVVVTLEARGGERSRGESILVTDAE